MQHNNFSIKQINTGNGRKYEIKEDNGTTHSLVSVTTLLDKFKDKTALFNWRKSVGDEEANKVSNAAATRGTKTHTLIENYLLKQELPQPSEDESYKLFSNLLPVVNLITPIAVEEKTYWVNNETGVGFAGTCDMWASINGCKLINRATKSQLSEDNISFISDWKTWNKAKYPVASNRDGQKYYPLLSYGLQLACYCAAINQRTNGVANLSSAFIFGVTHNCRQPFIYYFSNNAIMFYWQNIKQMINCYYNNEWFDWRTMEQQADSLGYLGDRCDIINDK